jgi:hypothetical protein
MICQRVNPEASQGTTAISWGITTDKTGDVLGVVCPSWITGGFLAVRAKGDPPKEAA